MALQTRTVYINRNVFPSEKVPLGHSVSIAESALGTPSFTEDLIFELSVFSAVQATDVAGFNNLINSDLQAAIDTYISSTNGFGVNVSAHTVSYNAEVKNIFLGNHTDIYRSSTWQNPFRITVQIRVYIS